MITRIKDHNQVNRLIMIILVSLVVSVVGCSTAGTQALDSAGEGTVGVETKTVAAEVNKAETAVTETTVAEVTTAETIGPETIKPATETALEEYVYVPDEGAKHSGAVGLGTWSTSIFYDSFKVTDNRDDKILYANEFDGVNALEGWRYFNLAGGNWNKSVSDFQIREFESNLVLSIDNKTAKGITAYVGDPKWNNYTVSVKGRPTDGGESLELFFCVKDERNYYFLSIGGWRDTSLCIQRVIDGKKSIVTDEIALKLKRGNWYTLAVKVGKDVIDGFFNGEKIFTVGESSSASS